MPQTDITQTTTTTMTSSVSNYAMPTKSSDGTQGQKENKWSNPNFTKYYGLYDTVGEFKSAINAYATWVIGKGYTVALARHKFLLENITGWGEDTFLSIIWQMIVVKKFNGDSYSHIIINDGGNLINLKPLDPAMTSQITDEKGILVRYEYTQGDGVLLKLKPSEVLHFCNGRMINENHGTAITKSVEWVCNAIQEARTDFRRLLHRSTVRILYVPEDDKTRMANLKKDYAEAITKGELLIIPVEAKDAKFEDLTVPATEAYLRWLEYLEDKFYKSLGVPKVVLGGTSENTEASAKVGVISYEPIWTQEVAEVEADLWNQLAIKIFINKQPSLMDNMQSDEAKNTGQTKLQYQGSQ